MNCLYCKFSNAIISDNHNDLHTLCSCAESENFLKRLDIVFDGCDCGQKEDDNA